MRVHSQHQSAIGMCVQNGRTLAGAHHHLPGRLRQTHHRATCILGILTQVMKIPLFSIPAAQLSPFSSELTAQGILEGSFSLSPTQTGADGAGAHLRWWKLISVHDSQVM